MRKCKLLVCLLLAVCLLGTLGIPALAADSGREKYTYTVRLFDGQDVIVYTAHYGDTVVLDKGQGSDVAGTQYYRKGVRVAGQDSGVYGTDCYVMPYNLTVKQDMDFVVAYGLKGNMVAYTVNYVDEAGAPVTPNDGYGNALPSSETYYGNIGDRIIVSYRQVEGYVPQAYNLAKTLTADPGNNVFTFVYTPVLGPANPAEEEAAPGIADDGAVIPDGGVPLDQGPEDLIDLDEDDTPLGLIDMGQDAVEKGADLLKEMPFGARVGLIGLDLLGLWLIFMAIVNHRNKKRANKEEE